MYRLHQWYIEKRSSGLIAWGNVTGHLQFPDTMNIHTSLIQDINITGNDINIITLNSVYVCSANEFMVTKLNDLEALVNEDYIGLLTPVLHKLRSTDFKEPEVAANEEVILFLGNTRSYYFDKMVIDHNGEYAVKKEIYPHIGMFQDSVICDYWIGEECFDLRYFPYQGNKMQFYTVDKPENVKLYIENMGNANLTVGINGRVYKIKPSERHEILPYNPNEKHCDIDGTDLYPAEEL